MTLAEVLQARDNVEKVSIKDAKKVWLKLSEYDRMTLKLFTYMHLYNHNEWKYDLICSVATTNVESYEDKALVIVALDYCIQDNLKPKKFKKVIKDIENGINIFKRQMDIIEAYERKHGIEVN